MQRRLARQRKDYLYRKSLELQAAAQEQKKARLKRAVDSGSSVPTELRNEYHELAHELEMEDEATKEKKTHIDDEYARAGESDPVILLTTSRDPSSRLLQFAKELKVVFPNCVRMNRGGADVKEVIAAARENDMSDVIIVHEHRGEPNGLIVCHLPFGPTCFFGLSHVVMRHDLPERPAPMSEEHPHLVFHGFSTRLGSRVANILKYLFPVPRDDARRVITFANRSDFISFRHHTFRRVGGARQEVELAEAGPRFELRPFQVRLGTLDQPDADVEWVLRPYMNTAKRQRRL